MKDFQLLRVEVVFSKNENKKTKNKKQTEVNKKHRESPWLHKQSLRLRPLVSGSIDALKVGWLQAQSLFSLAFFANKQAEEEKKQKEMPRKKHKKEKGNDRKEMNDALKSM